IALPSVSGKPPHPAMTIICCLPSLPVEVFGICSLLSSVISPPTFRLETSRLNSLPSWVKSQAIDYALTGACFHAGEIRVLDSSRSFESQTQSVFHRHAQRNSSRRRDARQESRLPHCRSRGRGPRPFLKARRPSSCSC